MSSSNKDDDVLFLRERWAKLAQLGKETKAKLSVTDKQTMTIIIDPVSDGYISSAVQQLGRYWSGDSCQQTVEVLRILFNSTQKRLEMFESQHELNVVNIKDKVYLVDSETRLYKSHAEPYRALIEEVESALKGLDVLQATYNDEGIVVVFNKDCVALAKKHREIYARLTEAFDKLQKLPPLATGPTTLSVAVGTGAGTSTSAGAMVASGTSSTATTSTSTSAAGATATTATTSATASDGKAESKQASSFGGAGAFSGLGGSLPPYSAPSYSSSVLSFGAGSSCVSASSGVGSMSSNATAIKSQSMSSMSPVYTTSSSFRSN
jgi:hypothetical protein